MASVAVPAILHNTTGLGIPKHFTISIHQFRLHVEPKILYRYIEDDLFYC